MMSRIAFLLFMLFLFLASSIHEGRCEDIRDAQFHNLQLGIKMFPVLVGGNLEIENKKNARNQLLLMVLYNNNRLIGQQVANTLSISIRHIAQFPIQVEVQAISALGEGVAEPVAGIFIAESLTIHQLKSLTLFGITNKIIIFSPFAGDVQNGVLAGMHISTQVKPAINLSTLRQSGLRLNPLFFKVAKTYE